MLARFLTAIVLATALAAVLAGTDTAAQAPPAQKPAAAAAEQAPKIPKAWPPDAETLSKRRLEAEALPLFAEPGSHRGDPHRRLEGGAAGPERREQEDVPGHADHREGWRRRHAHSCPAPHAGALAAQPAGLRIRAAAPRAAEGPDQGHDLRGPRLHQARRALPERGHLPAVHRSRSTWRTACTTR